MIVYIVYLQLSLPSQLSIPKVRVLLVFLQFPSTCTQGPYFIFLELSRPSQLPAPKIFNFIVFLQLSAFPTTCTQSSHFCCFPPVVSTPQLPVPKIRVLIVFLQLSQPFQLPVPNVHILFSSSCLCLSIYVYLRFVFCFSQLSQPSRSWNPFLLAHALFRSTVESRQSDITGRGGVGLPKMSDYQRLALYMYLI